MKKVKPDEEESEQQSTEEQQQSTGQQQAATPQQQPEATTAQQHPQATMLSITQEQLQQIIAAATTAAVQASQHRPPTTAPDRQARPTLSSGITPEKWSYFISKWNRYKCSTELTGQKLKYQLIECCDEELQLTIHRAFGDNVASKTEAQILQDIKRYAVKDENKLISRNSLRCMMQRADEDIKHFAARIKGQAEICDYTVQCTSPNCGQIVSYIEEEIKDQICKGLYDQEIRQAILSHHDQKLKLDELISFISTRELGKKSNVELNEGAQCSKISAYRKAKFSEVKEVTKTLPSNTKCYWCGKTGHGYKAKPETRHAKCPAYGNQCKNCKKENHFSEVCNFHKKLSNKYITENKEDSSDNENTLLVNTVGEIETNSISSSHQNEATNSVPIPHKEYTTNTGWENRKPKQDPIIHVDVSTCQRSYESNQVKYPPSHTICIPAVADTGARTTVAGTALVTSLGLTVEDLFPVKQRLCGANNTSLKILGGLFLSIRIQSQGSMNESKVLCYIQDDNPENFYLSRTVCEELNLINTSFPTPLTTSNNCVKIERNEVIACTCPLRSKPPPMPEELPYPPTEENREKLEQWLLKYYASSTFNTCEHQSLPMMDGPPLHIIVNKDATPHAVHTPIPVPAHWQKEVKQGLDRDVQLGVIEPVPWGTPTTWCARMITVAKKDGTPRRTVDLQHLNSASVRQTHHTQSPFHQASSVPHNTKKTVCDAWNGYHSIPIREDDRDLTTFITPWGRYRYRTAPQGYLAAGDAYTRRYDEIISEIPNKAKVVDDTILWGSNMAESFFLTCKFLDKCGSNGIILNPKKFTFGRDEVDFAGFTITRDSVKPCSKYLESILSFPEPTDITGIRSWFGLINQISYAVTLTDELQPFRDLLKPKNKFYWDENLKELFEDSKKKIVAKVENGVKIFEPNLKTCLRTDWSRNGTGFILTQKHCKCSGDNVACCNTGWKVVFAGSKFNNKAESQYAPIEGECLAVARALFKARHFILGCKDLIIATDHKPLLKILNNRSMDDIHNPRLLNLKEKTLRFRFNIVHINGKINSGADAMSRYPSENAPKEYDEDDIIADEADFNALRVAVCSLSSIDNLQVLTWDKVQEETLKDGSLRNLMRLIQDGFPEHSQHMPEGTSEYFRFRNDLMRVDNVILYKSRIIIPKSLRRKVLENIHSAHQGVSSMLSRVETSVFWPGITQDVHRLRKECEACNIMAPSQPSAPSTPLTHPQYPFQLVCADYFDHKGVKYLVLVDRYSNWPSVLKARDGGSAKQLVEVLKHFCEIYGIPEELASDGGPQFTATETKNFLRDWGIRHRISSTAFPHSNCRAELAVKTVKRLLTNNVGPHGTLEVDKYRRAMLQYKNTPDPDTKLSPAQIVFGRSIRDFTPMSKHKYQPAKVWTHTADMRERALSKRHARQRERLDEHTRRLPVLTVGDHVYVQNQVGNNPLRWDKSGKVLEVRPYDQYSIKMDGSGRITVRNRKFLRKFTPFNPSAGTLNQYLDQIGPHTPSSDRTHPTATGNSEEQDLIANSEASSTNACPSTSTPTSSSDATATTCNDGSRPVQSTAQVPLRRSTRVRRPNTLLEDFVT